MWVVNSMRNIEQANYIKIRTFPFENAEAFLFEIANPCTPKGADNFPFTIQEI